MLMYAQNAEKSTKANVGVQSITQVEFAKKYFNYSDSTASYKGRIPIIVDFYADWCVPCKRMAPILEELSEAYAGKIIFLKINVDNNKDVAYALGIQSIPTFFYFAKGKQPMKSIGGLTKEQMVEIIEEQLLSK